jgi:hypothetical protein
MRYGKLEADASGTNAESTKGESYRVQIYEKVIDAIGMPVSDPVGKGSGWKYESINLKATEQYTQSFGAISDNSFYRLHIHEYPGLSKSSLSTYTGIDYTNTLGGTNTFYEELTEWASGKKSNSIVLTCKTDKYSLANTQYESGVEKTSETITFNKDNFNINIIVSKTISYTFTMAAGDISIKLNTGDTKATKIQMTKEGKINIDPGTSKSPDAIMIGGSSIEQALVTKSWIDMMFNNHIHPTTGPGAPTLPPVPIPIVAMSSPTTPLTFITKVE